MLRQLIRKLIPAADAVPVGQIGVLVIQRLCDLILISERLIRTGENDLIADAHFFRQRLLR